MVEDDDPMPLSLLVIPYFWLRLLAVRKPAAACSPCLWPKLFAVDAALLASESVTLDGSLRMLLAVLNAACFSAQVVPVLGAAVDGDDPACPGWSSFCRGRAVGSATVGGGASTRARDGDAIWRGGTGGEAV